MTLFTNNLPSLIRYNIGGLGHQTACCVSLVYSLVVMVENKHMNDDSSTGEIQSMTQIGVLTGDIGDQSEGKE